MHPLSDKLARRFADLAVTAANTSLFKNYTQPCIVDTYADIKVTPPPLPFLSLPSMLLLLTRHVNLAACCPPCL